MAVNINKQRCNKKTIDLVPYYINAAEKTKFSLRDIIIWVKRNTRPIPPNSLQYYLDDGWEYILLFAKGEAKIHRNNIVQNVKPNYIMTNIGFAEKSNLESSHPVKFLTEVPNFIYRLCTQENDIILDPFAGIGSSLISGINNNLNVIGCELNINFCRGILYEINKLLLSIIILSNRLTVTKFS